MTQNFEWTDNPTLAGISDYNPDVLNECLMHLKYNGFSNIEEEIDIINTNLANKLNSDFSNTENLLQCHVIIDSHFNGFNGFVIFDDGLCLQVGKNLSSTTINLAKTYKDLNFIILSVPTAERASGYCRNNILSEDSIMIHEVVPGQGNVSGDCFWLTLGFLEESEY